MGRRKEDPLGLSDIMASALLVVALAHGAISAPEWYAPAYYEPMDSILLLATSVTSMLPARFKGTYPTTPTEVQAEMAKALHEHVHVRILVTPGSSQRAEFEAALRNTGVALPAPNVSFLNVSHCDIWARDTGPIWLRQRSGGGRMMVTPTFSLWGYLIGDHVDGEWASCDVPNRVPDQLAPLLSIPVEHARPFVTEGGDKSFNGRGTVIMSKAVECARARNAQRVRASPPTPSRPAQRLSSRPCLEPCVLRGRRQQRHPNLTIAEIEGLARTYLRVSHIVWTDEGVADDEQSFRGPQEASGGRSVYTTIGTGGHVDECARFVDPTTIVLPQLTAEQARAPDMT